MEQQIKAVRLTKEQLVHLDADLEMYYHKFGTKKILELWPTLRRKYIVSRANGMGLTVSKSVLARNNIRSGKYITVQEIKPVDKSKERELQIYAASKPWRV